MTCEDYPCCGHDFGDCQERMKCVVCGRRQPKTAKSSICLKCRDRLGITWTSTGALDD